MINFAINRSSHFEQIADQCVQCHVNENNIVVLVDK